MKTVIRHLRRAALLQEGSGPTDERLLEMFLARRDEAAFEALMRRHGPMVLGVCRRVLRNVHDAEDAFQATFVVFVRKAGSLRTRGLLANWLYGVAYRTSMKARAMNAKRRTKERLVAEKSRPAGEDCEELLQQLDHELSRLPDKYRVPVILCELEGKSRKEVARLLGVPEGTLSWRLAQARKMLARRLSRNELAIPVGILAVGLSPTLQASTLKTVLTTGAIPANVLTLTEGVMKAMLLSKLKITACAVALMVLAGVGATGLTYRATAQEPKQVEYVGSALIKNAENRLASDDLEALRLEIEALRKSLQATRERVKTLEGEVTALKGQRPGPQGIAPGGKRSGSQDGLQGGGQPGQKSGTGGRMPGGGGMMGMSMGGMGGIPKMPGSTSSDQSVTGRIQKPRKTDPVTDAEEAIKKLRSNPGDKKATEELERALQRLKVRDKPDVPR